MKSTNLAESPCNVYIVTLNTDHNELWEQMQFSVQNRSKDQYIDNHQGTSNHCQQQHVPATTFLFCRQKDNPHHHASVSAESGPRLPLSKPSSRVPWVRLRQQLSPRPEMEANGAVTKAVC